MSFVRMVAVTWLAMLAFAGNSLLCRMALSQTLIDPASFTAIRLLTGAIFLQIAVTMRGGISHANGSWISAIALLAYALGFSFAYVRLSAATGTLLLFGAVQATMITVSVCRGERLSLRQIVGVVIAFGGLIALLLPGLAAPPLGSAGLMAGAGVAWGVYSLRGRGAEDSTRVTAGNFLRAAPIALLLCLALPPLHIDQRGVICAALSGALASGLGYTLWYAVLPSLKSTVAAVVQLSVPVIATLSGSALLDEVITFRVMLASTTILGGISIVIIARRRV